MKTAISTGSVRDIPLFAGLPEEVKDELLKAGRLVKFPKGKVIFAIGEKVTHFYIIIEGAIKLFRDTADGYEKTTDILTTSHTIGERDFFHPGHVYNTNAEIVNEATVLEFPISWLKNTAQKHSVFALNLLSLISEYEYMAELEAEHQANMSSAQMVACFLQRICVIHDYNPGEFELPYNKSLIASRLGMEVETFSRTLSTLRENGITVSGNKVRIHNAEAFDEFVCDACSVAEDCATHKAMQKKLFNASEKLA